MICSRLAVLFLLINSVANAHVQLTEQILATSVSDIRELQKTIANLDNNQIEARAAAAFEIAATSTDLVALMNADAAAHNSSQTDILIDAVQRLSEADIGVTWSEAHQRYFYDCAEYEAYLRLLPNGVRAADSLFHVLERDYFQSDDTEMLEVRAAQKFGFLQRFPDYGEAARIQIFLSIDYRDLWRLCAAREDHECTAQFSALAFEQLQNLLESSPDGAYAAIATGLLERFEEEFGHSLQAY